jgi:nitric-oxide synthase
MYFPGNSIKILLSDVNSFGVFALGSSAYPNFCGFGKWLDTSLTRLNGNRVLQVGLGDELGDRDGEFRRWSRLAFQKSCIETGIETEPISSQPDRVAARWKVISNDVTRDRGISQIVKGQNMFTSNEKSLLLLLIRMLFVTCSVQNQ